MFKYFHSTKRGRSAPPVRKGPAKGTTKIRYMRNLASVFAVTVSMAHKYHKSDAQGVKFNS